MPAQAPIIQCLMHSLSGGCRINSRFTLSIWFVAFMFTMGMLCVYEYSYSNAGKAVEGNYRGWRYSSNGGNVHVGNSKDPAGHVHEKVVETAKLNSSEYAYIFYATSYEYACSALVNIQRLRHHPSIKTRGANIGIYVPKVAKFETMKVASSDNGVAVSTTHHEMDIKQKFKDLGAFVIQEDPPPFLKNPIEYYKDVLLKLSTISVYKHYPSLKRIIVLDSDQLILQNLDHLFSLPSAAIAAPRNYWGGKGYHGITSTLMVIEPNEGTWERVVHAMEAMKEGEYDMEVVNKVFEDEVIPLPGRYCTLNSHWETVDFPAWWRPKLPMWSVIFPKKEKRRDQAESVASSAPPTGTPNSATSTSLSSPQVATQTYNSVMQTFLSSLDLVADLLPPKESLPILSLAELNYTNLSQPSGPNSNKPPILDPLILLLYNPLDPESSSAVIHFTALGKPWSFSLADVREQRPRAHWGFAEIWKSWREEVGGVCEGWLSG